MNPLEMELNSFILGPSQAEQERAERRQAQWLDHELRERMNKIVEIWTGFVNEYNGKQAFNVRKARELSKAFRELERVECWPKPAHAK